MRGIEDFFEKVLWNSRLFILLAVVFGMVGAIILFIVGSVDIFSVASNTVSIYIHHNHPQGFHAAIVGSIIGAIDLYLIAVVLLLFSFGLYELFISEIDVAKTSESSKVLEIHNLDQLKDKLAKVIVMVLVVSFFKTVLHTTYNGPLQMLYFAASILALSVGLYFLHKDANH